MNKIIILYLILFLSCNKSNFLDSHSSFPLSEEFKNYWFDGKAEISNYILTQSRYGSIRKGSAVLIYVTEDFLPKKQVKANKKTKYTQNILKLNRTKKFLTGIYPYSIMTGIFLRLGQNLPLIKTSTSIQEWCGQTYLQINRRKTLEITGHSYFEEEADEMFNLKNDLTEEELWVWIRTQPKILPQGKKELLPSLEYLRMNHKPIKFYEAILDLQNNDTLNIYSLYYPELKRKLSIYYEPNHPYQILKWNEYDLENEKIISSAVLEKMIKLPYWELNKIGDEHFRDSLNLK